MNSDDIDQLSKTVLFIGKPGSKFYQKTFDQLTSNDANWLLAQGWFRDPTRSKLSKYLDSKPFERALQKGLDK